MYTVYVIFPWMAQKELEPFTFHSMAHFYLGSKDLLPGMFLGA